MTKRITYARLKALKACPEQLALFKKQFGRSTEVTASLCVSVASLFDWDWAARRLLSPAAEAKYDKACDPARAEYDKARVPIWAEYDKGCAAAWAECDKACAAAAAECDKACAAAWAERDKARAVAFAILYNPAEPEV